MANKNTAAKAAASKKTATAPKEEVVIKEVEAQVEAPVVAAETPKKRIKLDDAVRVRVRSNRYGTLGFTNNSTGDRFIWHDIDDVQDLTVGDIRNMRGNAPIFFRDCWIWIESIEETGCENLTDAEMYEALGLYRYYNEKERPHYFSSVREWTAERVKAEVPQLSDNTKSNLAMAVQEAVDNELIVSLPVIKAWEKALECELTGRE